MDIAALKRAGEKLAEKTGSSGFLSQKNLTEDTIVRVLPPSLKLNGLPYMEVKKAWIAGKPIIDCSTFGKESVIEQELTKAKMSKDADLVSLANNTNDKTGVSFKTEFWIALLHLEYKLGKNNEIKGIVIIDDTAKIFQCTSQMCQAMLKCLSHRKAMNGSDDGLADMELGMNLALSKVGQKLNTKYDAALDEQMDMTAYAKYYAEVPDVYDIAKGQMKLIKYQRAVIRQYLYGEDIPAEIEQAEKDRVEALKEAHKAAATPVKRKKVADDDEEEVVITKKKKVVVEDDDEDDVPVKKVVKKKPVVEDDDDEEEVPVKKVVKKKPVVEDDDDDDDIPVVKKKVAKKKPVTEDDDDEEIPVKKVAKKKAIVEDDDDEEEVVIPKKKAAPTATQKKTKTVLDDLEDLDDDDDF